MNDVPNTMHWRRGCLVIHDADAKREFMLMVVIGFTHDGVVKTRYVDGDRHGRKIYYNVMAVLHDPARFGIALPLHGGDPKDDELTQEALQQRAKVAAWDFLAAYARDDPVPGATLGDYLDAAIVYAFDETGIVLAAQGGGDQETAQ